MTSEYRFTVRERTKTIDIPNIWTARFRQTVSLVLALCVVVVFRHNNNAQC